ncbi:MAG TPA: family 16 glycoside hydrolase [Pirellulales bacterium]|jgi:hypothetical protein|nr:family 16 glycoside hydrolase [Pirellulales bacterium]
MRRPLLVLALLVCVGSIVLADDPSIIFSDDFSTLDPAWGGANNNLRVDGGNMVMQPDAQSSYTTLYSGNNFNDIDATITVTQTDGMNDEPAGIAFWGTDTDNFYVANFQTDGSFAVGRNENAKWLFPVSWSTQAAVKKGLNQANELRVVAKGKTATVYINGTQVTSFKGFPPDGGSQIGIHSESGAKVYTWKFSNLVVRTPK